MKDLSDLPEAWISPAWREGPWPLRPWWVYDRSRSGMTFMARPGVAWFQIGATSQGDEPVEVLSWSCIEAQALVIDAQRPIPKPPYRCGQIWAWVDPDEGRWRSSQISFLSDGRPAGLVAHFRAKRLVLLHDPLVPTDAPWSSS